MAELLVSSPEIVVPRNLPMEAFAKRVVGGLVSRGYMARNYPSPEVLAEGRIVHFPGAGTRAYVDEVLHPLTEAAGSGPLPTDRFPAGLLHSEVLQDDDPDSQLRAFDPAAHRRVVDLSREIFLNNGDNPRRVRGLQTNRYGLQPGSFHLDGSRFSLIMSDGDESYLDYDPGALDEELMQPGGLDMAFQRGEVPTLPTITGDITLIEGRELWHRGRGPKTSHVLFESPQNHSFRPPAS